LNDVTLVTVAIMCIIAAFAFGHIIGYSRGLKRVTCPTCNGRGSVPVARAEEGAP
jgi:hypothetical protein